MATNRTTIPKRTHLEEYEHTLSDILTDCLMGRCLMGEFIQIMLIITLVVSIFFNMFEAETRPWSLVIFTFLVSLSIINRYYNRNLGELIEQAYKAKKDMILTVIPGQEHMTIFAQRGDEPEITPSVYDEVDIGQANHISLYILTGCIGKRIATAKDCFELYESLLTQITSFERCEGGFKPVNYIRTSPKNTPVAVRFQQTVISLFGERKKKFHKISRIPIIVRILIGAPLNFEMIRLVAQDIATMHRKNVMMLDTVITPQDKEQAVKSILSSMELKYFASFLPTMREIEQYLEALEN